MSVYNRVTSAPYQYVLIDCKPETPTSRQLVSDVFENCKSFPNIQERSNVVSSFPNKRERSNIASSFPNNRERSIVGSERVHSQEISAKRGNGSILKLNGQRGPIVVKLTKREWSEVSADFRQSETYGNAPAGWNVWRIYVTEAFGRDSTYLPVVLTHSTDGEMKTYKVSRSWLMDSTCGTIKRLL
jgi:hypothetical protein